MSKTEKKAKIKYAVKVAKKNIYVTDSRPVGTYYTYAVSDAKAISNVAHQIYCKFPMYHGTVYSNYVISVVPSLPIESAPAQPDKIRAKLSQAVQLNLFD